MFVDKSGHGRASPVLIPVSVTEFLEALASPKAKSILRPVGIRQRRRDVASIAMFESQLITDYSRPSLDGDSMRRTGRETWTSQCKEMEWNGDEI